MPTRHRSAWRRRWRSSRRLRVAVPIAIPVALALILGIVIASSDGKVPGIQESALGTCASPSVAAAGASPSASASPCATTSAAAGPTATAMATTPAVNPEAGRPDLAEATPADPMGNAISLNQSAAQAANSLNCTLIAPANPLSAKGLATPWQLGDGCSEANPNEEAFVEATILAPNGKLAVYDPLVITQGSTAAVTPTAPTIPRGSQVIINAGFNGNNLVLEGAGAFQGRCIDAFGNSIIAQTSACNAAAFYADANAQIARGRLKARIAAFRSQLAARYPGVTVLATQTAASDTPGAAASLVTGDLKAHSDLGGVLALTQNTTQGAITALGQAHETGKVKLATFDASPFQMTGLTTGTIQLTVAQEPGAEGADAVDQAVNAVAGKKVVPYMSTPMIAITPQNMNRDGIKPFIYDGTCTSSLRGFMTSGD